MAGYSSAMNTVRLLACIVLLMAVAAEAATPSPKKVACKDRRFFDCYNVTKYCPVICPHSCAVDCFACEALCLPNQPPPPPKKRPPPHPKKKSPPPPPRKNSPPPPPPNKYPPPTPPAHTPPPTWTPPPVATPPPPPPTLSPPPLSTPPLPPSLNATPPPPQTSSPPPLLAPPPTPTSIPTPPPRTLSPPPISTPPSPPTSNSTPPSPPPEVSGKRVFCKNRWYPQCYRMEQRCPSACPDSCEVDCVTCSPVCNCNRPGAVCQDPRFIGADGITFYFHGKKDQDFCIVSDSNLHINAHFIGRRNENMRRDFTWVQSLGILFDDNQIFVGAKKTATWDNAADRLDLAFNGQPIFLSEGEGAKRQPAPGVSITRSRDTNAVVIEVEGNFQIKAIVVPITEKDSQIHEYGITDEDCFAHLDLSLKFYSLTGSVNGVLGQTYASNYVSRVKMGIDMPVLGGDKQFASSNLFSIDCAVARFSGIPFTSANNFEYVNLDCESGLDGRGVVWKR